MCTCARNKTRLQSEGEARRALAEISAEVQQLRQKRPPSVGGPVPGSAEEIERLRKELEALRQQHRSLSNEMQSQVSPSENGTACLSTISQALSFEEAMGRLQRERDAAIARAGTPLVSDAVAIFSHLHSHPSRHW